MPAPHRVVLRLLPGELGLLVPGLVHGEPERVRGPGGQAGQHGRAQGPGHSLKCGEKKYLIATDSKFLSAAKHSNTNNPPCW